MPRTVSRKHASPFPVAILLSRETHFYHVSETPDRVHLSNPRLQAIKKNETSRYPYENVVLSSKTTESDRFEYARIDRYVKLVAADRNRAANRSRGQFESVQMQIQASINHLFLFQFPMKIADHEKPEGKLMYERVQAFSSFLQRYLYAQNTLLEIIGQMLCFKGDNEGIKFFRAQCSFEALIPLLVRRCDIKRQIIPSVQQRSIPAGLFPRRADVYHLLRNTQWIVCSRFCGDNRARNSEINRSVICGPIETL